MTKPRNLALGAARTLEQGKRTTAERALAAGLDRLKRAQARLDRARDELERLRAASAPAMPSRGASSTGLALRRHAAHARARTEQIRELEQRMHGLHSEHAACLRDVERARAALGERMGKERAIEEALSAEQARERRARERREQDEQDELHVHKR